MKIKFVVLLIIVVFSQCVFVQAQEEVIDLSGVYEGYLPRAGVFQDSVVFPDFESTGRAIGLIPEGLDAVCEVILTETEESGSMPCSVVNALINSGFNEMQFVDVDSEVTQLITVQYQNTGVLGPERATAWWLHNEVTPLSDPVPFDAEKFFTRKEGSERLWMVWTVSGGLGLDYEEENWELVIMDGNYVVYSDGSVARQETLCPEMEVQLFPGEEPITIYGDATMRPGGHVFCDSSAEHGFTEMIQIAEALWYPQLDELSVRSQITATSAIDANLVSLSAHGIEFTSSAYAIDPIRLTITSYAMWPYTYYYEQMPYNGIIYRSRTWKVWKAISAEGDDYFITKTNSGEYAVVNFSE